MNLYNKTINNISGLDRAAMEIAQKRLDYLLKPQGSLGKLEEIVLQIAGIHGKVPEKISKKEILVMAGDNGVVEENISSFPGSVSLLVTGTMVKGISGAAVLAKHAGAGLKVVDLGLDSDHLIEGVIDKKIRKGTSNFIKGPAMSEEEVMQAITTGIEIASQSIEEGVDLFGTGEVGIGNTTTSSAVLYALTGEDPDLIVGRGAGLDDAALAHKKALIKESVDAKALNQNDVLSILAQVGGFDIAGLVGCYLGAAACRVPIIIDGFIAGVAALAAQRICPIAVGYMLASHHSEEPGALIVNRELNKSAMLNMKMRLGEGTGCALAFNLVEAALCMYHEMGTFGDIGM